MVDFSIDQEILRKRNFGIVKDFKERIKVAALAKKYGLSRKRIYNILKEHKIDYIQRW